MLDEIGGPENVKALARRKRAADPKFKIMGFGHRVYKVKDPRATVLQELAEHVFAETSRPKKYEMALELERVCAGHLRAEGHLSERRFLLRHRLPGARHPARPVHADLRHRPRRRLAGPLAGAAREQPHLPAGADLRRQDATCRTCRWKSDRNRTHVPNRLRSERTRSRSIATRLELPPCSTPPSSATTSTPSRPTAATATSTRRRRSRRRARRRAQATRPARRRRSSSGRTRSPSRSPKEKDAAEKQALIAEGKRAARAESAALEKKLKQVEADLHAGLLDASRT